MNQIKAGSLGETWLKLVDLTLKAGSPLANEGREVLGVEVLFPAASQPDPVLAQFGDREMMAQMEKVFFEDGTNALGHSYAKLMRGPDGRNDLTDVIALLKAEPFSKRAVVTLCGNGHGKVPCINTIQFLVREGSVQAIYFARGQDAFRKFYADALCVLRMTQTVAQRLSLPTSTVRGFIGSSHIYDADKAGIDKFLSEGAVLQANDHAKGTN
jgi:thymidylate synthase